MSQIHQEILRCLRYFAYFYHPLRADEIHRYVRIDCRRDMLFQALKDLVSEGKIINRSGLFSFDDKHIEERLKNQHANRRLYRIGIRMGKLIARFPFVRGVYISGSISKEGARGKDDDVDFFILTEPGRLWTAKFFLIAFKKIFLLNSKKYFCINFLKSTDNLKLTRNNIYIATEAASLIPVRNKTLLRDFYQENQWVFEYFPNFSPPDIEDESNINQHFRPIEKFLKGRIGNRFEKKLYMAFSKHASEKYAGQRNADFNFNQNTAAHFPNSPEKMILEYYNE
jgi:hypothetical protein